MAYTTLLSNSKKTKKFQINEDNKSAQFHLKYPQILINKNNVSKHICLKELKNHTKKYLKQYFDKIDRSCGDSKVKAIVQGMQCKQIKAKKPNQW